MLKRIYAPKKIDGSTCKVDQVLVARDDRVYRDSLLLSLVDDTTRLAIAASGHGWVRYVAVKLGDQVKPGELLLIVDIVDVNEYRPDDAEVNPQVELGEEGRRGLERKIQKSFAQGYANELFDAPNKEGQGMGPGMREHPILGQMKESLPPKMRSNAAHNDVAIDHLAEEASRDPELQKQLSAQLQQDLQVSQAPSTSPQLKSH